MKQKSRCGISGCPKKSIWKFVIMGNRNVGYGCCEDFVLYRCIEHENTVNYDEKYILAKKKHPNKKMESRTNV